MKKQPKAVPAADQSPDGVAPSRTNARTVGSKPRQLPRHQLKLNQQVFGPLAVLAVVSAALYIILSKDYADGAEKWAFGVASFVLAYWLRKPG